jgi:uncharacterized repeat protein (TIGR03806 family)
MLKIIFILSVTILLLAGFTNRNRFVAVKPPETLSSFGFFTGDISLLQPEVGVVPYDLQTPLFSNYAEKARFIKLPAGSSVQYHATEEFDLPVGTYLVKSFYYPNDFRDLSKGRRIMETRVMLRDEQGWQTWPYIWNDAQTDAVYDPTGQTMQVSYINEQGKKVNTNYLVPNKNQCKGCHLQNNTVMPIGIAARHINSDYGYVAGTMNQLQYWKQQGMLQALPDKDIPANANWKDESQSLDARARAYLDINCGHCHRPDGPANTSGLFLYAHEKNATALGVMKTPVAAGRGSGNRQYDIVPGKPDASILLFRMQTNDPGIAMPEIGREQIHAEGVALIKEWIKKYKS